MGRDQREKSRVYYLYRKSVIENNFVHNKGLFIISLLADSSVKQVVLLSESAHNVNIFIFLSDHTFYAMNCCEKNFDLDKKRSFYEFLKPKNPIFLHSTVPLITRLTCSDVDSGTCDFRLDSSRLF